MSDEKHNSDIPNSDPREWQPFRMPEERTLHVVGDPYAHATMNREFTWVLEWRPDRHIMPGTHLELRSHSFRTMHDWQYTEIRMDEADVYHRVPFEVTPSVLWEMKGCYVIARARLQYGLRMGEPLRITLTARGHRWPGHSDFVNVWLAEAVPYEHKDTREPEFRKDLRAVAELTIRPGVVERFAVYAQPMPGPNGKVRTLLVPEDRFGNAGAFEKPVPVALAWNGKTWTEHLAEVKELMLDPPDGVGRLVATIPMSSLAYTENIENGVRTGGALVVTGNPVWAESPNGKQAAFGEIHWHTEISGDGALSLREALRRGRDHLNMDFMAPGDHNPSPAKWRYTVETLDDANKDGVFATLYGYEWSTNQGHENFYLLDAEHPVRPFGEAGIPASDTYPPHMQEKLAKHEGFFAVPHHTNSICESRRTDDDTPFFFQYSWTTPTDYHRLVEIFQARGNQEKDGLTDAWCGWYSTAKAGAQDALELGYKLGFTAGTDNHVGHAGRCTIALEGIGRLPRNCISLTGLWTDKVERRAVWQALYDRRAWAAVNTRALVYYTVNGVESGSETEVEKGDPLTARIKMSVEDAVQSIEIVSDRKTVWKGNTAELDFDMEAALGNADHTAYFYLRALLRNGGIIYASPVFVAVR